MTVSSVSRALSTSSVATSFAPYSSSLGVSTSKLTKSLLASIVTLSLMGVGLSSAYAAQPDAAKLAVGVEQKVLDWRRDLHQHPELSNREFRTSKIIEKHLKSLGLEVQTGIAHTGVLLS